jgi:hypothetical protein
MYPRISYLNAANKLRAMWVCANTLAWYMPYRRFIHLDAERFSVEFVELDYYLDLDTLVTPITRAISRAANMANCTEFEVIAALAATPKFVAYRICDYLDALANWDMHNIPADGDMFSAVYGKNKFILQCLVMALLED